MQQAIKKITALV